MSEAPLSRVTEWVAADIRQVTERFAFGRGGSIDALEIAVREVLRGHLRAERLSRFSLDVTADGPGWCVTAQLWEPRRVEAVTIRIGID